MYFKVYYKGTCLATTMATSKEEAIQRVYASFSKAQPALKFYTARQV